MDELEAAWREIAWAHLRHALGEATADAAIAEIRRIAEAAGLQSDARVWKLDGLLTTSKDDEAKRQRARHEARNGAAAVIATVELAESILRHESPEAPLLASATPAERGELIEALRRGVLAARSLAAAIEEALGELPAGGLSRDR